MTVCSASMMRSAIEVMGASRGSAASVRHYRDDGGYELHIEREIRRVLPVNFDSGVNAIVSSSSTVITFAERNQAVRLGID